MPETMSSSGGAENKETVATMSTRNASSGESLGSIPSMSSWGAEDIEGNRVEISPERSWEIILTNLDINRIDVDEGGNVPFPDDTSSDVSDEFIPQTKDQNKDLGRTLATKGRLKIWKIRKDRGTKSAWPGLKACAKRLHIRVVCE